MKIYSQWEYHVLCSHTYIYCLDYRIIEWHHCFPSKWHKYQIYNILLFLLLFKIHYSQCSKKGFLDLKTNLKGLTALDQKFVSGKMVGWLLPVYVLGACVNSHWCERLKKNHELTERLLTNCKLWSRMKKEPLYIALTLLIYVCVCVCV